MSTAPGSPPVPVDDDGGERVFRRPLAVVSLLAAVAGYVDALAYLWLGVFVANMTGTIVFLGLAIGGESPRGLESLLALAGFAAGAAAGISLRTWGRRRGPRAGTVAPLAVECVLLAAVLAPTALLTTELRTTTPGGTGAFAAAALVALAAANGLQAFVITRVSGIATPTTYATGTVVATSSAAVGALADRGLAEGALWRRRWAVAATTPASYLAGAACYALVRGRSWAGLLPLAAMLAVLVLAARSRPRPPT